MLRKCLSNIDSDRDKSSTVPDLVLMIYFYEQSRCARKRGISEKSEKGKENKTRERDVKGGGYVIPGTAMLQT